MELKTPNQLSDLEEEKEAITVIHYIAGRTSQGHFVRTMRPVVKWFGVLSTLAWGIAALAPNMFNIPEDAQGWTFIVSIFWFFAFCAGAFNL